MVLVESSRVSRLHPLVILAKYRTKVQTSRLFEERHHSLNVSVGFRASPRIVVLFRSWRCRTGGRASPLVGVVPPCGGLPSMLY